MPLDIHAPAIQLYSYPFAHCGNDPSVQAFAAYLGLTLSKKRETVDDVGITAELRTGLPSAAIATELATHHAAKPNALTRLIFISALPI